MNEQQFYHEPVLKQEIIDLLVVNKTGIYLDCTLGGGGHFRAIAESLDTGATLVGIDRDTDAIEWNRNHPVSKQLNVIIEQSRFSDFDKVLDRNNISGIDGALLDLGVSSWQIDNPERGFSFMRNGSLDMRMDRSSGISAGDYINTVDECELARILDEFGEVKNASRMARVIKNCEFQIDTTDDLGKCLTNEYGPNLKYKVLAKVFQALRIAINDELGELNRFLEKIIRYLKPQGRVAVMAYHSLEDRIVKEFIRKAEYPCVCPPRLPICQCGKLAMLNRITKKALQASEQEIAKNPRSRSVRVRVAEKSAGAGM
jgi:16S rRNA (cytosine1402-N4)-methyltransferase